MKTKRGLPDMTWVESMQLWRKRGTYKGQTYALSSKTPEGVVEKIEAFKDSIDNSVVIGGASVSSSMLFYEYVQRWYLQTRSIK